MGKSNSAPTDNFLIKCAESAVSAAKLFLKTRRSGIDGGLKLGDRLIIMGNGPSLSQSIQESTHIFEISNLMAVNFFANTDLFFNLKPEFYVLADPVFFSGGNGSVDSLHQAINSIDWEMTLFLPFGKQVDLSWLDNEKVRPVRFNFVGIDGFGYLKRWAYGKRRGMPRPRNVLIPSIMIALWMGYKDIFLVGADHSWTRTLSVDEDNTVVSIQPHFYEEDASERERVASVYKDVRMHEILDSFRIAFRSYHEIQEFAQSIGAKIYNATPGSFIDAFPRRSLPK